MKILKIKHVSEHKPSTASGAISQCVRPFVDIKKNSNTHRKLAPYGSRLFEYAGLGKDGIWKILYLINESPRDEVGRDEVGWKISR